MLTAEQEAFLDKLSYEDRLCEVCIYAADGCEGGVHGGPTGPIYPPCDDSNYETFVNLTALESLMEEEAE